MAQIFSQDAFTALAKQTQIYSDFTSNMYVHPDLNDLVRVTNENAVKQSIIGIIKTSKYERPFQPNLGSNIQKFLFEPISNVTQQGLQDEISNVIANYEPRAKVISVVASPDFVNELYNVTITFYIVNISNPVTLSTILYRVR
jgi:phage baseplate assembly protein W